MLDQFACDNDIEGFPLGKRTQPLTKIMVHGIESFGSHVFDTVTEHIDADAGGCCGRYSSVQPLSRRHARYIVSNATDVEHVLARAATGHEFQPITDGWPPRLTQHFRAANERRRVVRVGSDVGPTAPSRRIGSE